MQNVPESAGMWDSLGLGCHICSIYRNEDEQFAPISSFFSEGLERGEKCIYIFDENTPEVVREQLMSRMTGSDKTKAHQVGLVSQSDSYTKSGAFDTPAMFALLKEAVDGALAEGYAGVRAAGEMTWVNHSHTPIDTFIDYERGLNDFHANNKVTGICQFHEDKFSPDLLVEMICTHPYLLIYGKLFVNKYFYTSPRYSSEVRKKIKSDDYATVLSIVLDEQPIGISS